MEMHLKLFKPFRLDRGRSKYITFFFFFHKLQQMTLNGYCMSRGQIKVQ